MQEVETVFVSCENGSLFWKNLHLQTDAGGVPIQHSLKSRATDQSSVLHQLGVFLGRLYWLYLSRIWFCGKHISVKQPSNYHYVLWKLEQRNSLIHTCTLTSLPDFTSHCSKIPQLPNDPQLLSFTSWALGGWKNDGAEATHHLWRRRRSEEETGESGEKSSMMEVWGVMKEKDSSRGGYWRLGGAGSFFSL